MLVKVGIGFAPVNVGLSLPAVHFWLQHQADIGIPESTLLDGAEIVS